MPASMSRFTPPPRRRAQLPLEELAKLTYSICEKRRVKTILF
jgi:hypothetical protein